MIVGGSRGRNEPWDQIDYLNDPYEGYQIADGGSEHKLVLKPVNLSSIPSVSSPHNKSNGTNTPKGLFAGHSIMLLSWGIR